MKKIILLIILSISYSAVIEQTAFKPGFVINNQGDTLTGYLRHNDFGKNTVIADFRKEKDGEGIKFRPGEIAGYRITGEYYYVTKNIGTAEDPHLIFAEYLVDAEEVDLYFYRDNKQRNRYFIQKDTLRIELENDIDTIWKQNYPGGDPIMKLKESKQYTGALTYVFSDQQQLWDKINKTEFNHDGLINITRKYHELTCPDRECMIYQKEKERAQLRYFPVYAFRQSTYTGFTAYDHAEKMRYNSDLRSVFGAGIEITLPQSSRRTAILVSLGYTNYEFLRTVEGGGQLYDLEETGSALGLTAGLKKFLTSGERARLYAHADILTEKYFSRSSSYHEFVINNIEIDYDPVYRDPLFDMSFGLSANLGIEIPLFSSGALFLEAGYIHQNVLEGVNVVGNIQNIRAATGFIF